MPNRRALVFGSAIAIVLAVAVGIWRGSFSGPGWKPAAPLKQEAYIWQRRWNDAVRDSVRQSEGLLDALLVQAAEITLRKGRIETVVVGVDWAFLAASRRRVGLSWRVTTNVISHGWTSEIRDRLGQIIRGTLAKARAAGIVVREAQLDCDCPTRALAGYAEFIRSLRAVDNGVPWTFTALPDWLRDPHFGDLARSSNGFVLQVHWLRPDPHAIDRPILMVPAEAREAVARASRIGVPFRVALPTYGSAVIRDGAGRWIDVVSEDQVPLPPGTQLMEAVASPADCLTLIREWSTTRPAWLEGVIWYRLPVSTDQRNWSWPQFEAVVRGRLPQAKFEVGLQPNAGGWEDVILKNVGDGDGFAPQDFRIEAADVLAADGVNEYHAEEIAGGTFRFSTAKAMQFKAGQALSTGWLRRGKVGAPFTVHFEP